MVNSLENEPMRDWGVYTKGERGVKIVESGLWL